MSEEKEILFEVMTPLGFQVRVTKSLLGVDRYHQAPCHGRERRGCQNGIGTA